MKKLILFTIFFTSLLSTANAQKDANSKSRASKVELGYAFGGTPRYHYLASYSGFTGSLLHGLKLSDQFHLYAGLGLEKLSDRNILPLIADFDYYNKKGNQFLNAKTGYAFAWGTRTEVDNNYQYRGGFHFSIGYGFHLLTQSKFNLRFLAAYNYRDTKLRYQALPDSPIYEDASKTHLFSFKTVFSF